MLNYLYVGSFFLFLRLISSLSGIFVFIKRICFCIEWDFFFSFINFNILIFLDFYFFFFLSIVRLIRSGVIFYRIYYIDGGKINNRFLFLLVIFIISIIFLIISPNLIRIFLGWDGLGLISYLLVNFYITNESLNSGILTVLSNRLGDIFLLIRIFFALSIGTIRFLLWDKFNIYIFIFFLLARFTKSAQLPFSRWLPFAIAAPTPVSSLVHSSTLVTAGVFLIFRIFDLIRSINLYIIFSRGIITILVSGICGIFESDLKKVIALSTLSQLGLIMVILGAGLKNFCFFHLVIHALFKSRLFIGIGVKIHEFSNFQDSRKLGLNWKNPIIDFLFGVTNLALVGFPFLSGFFSKDTSLEFIISRNTNFLIKFIFIFSVILTIGYRIKFIILRRLKFSRFNYLITHNNFTNKIVFLSLIILLSLSIIFGYIYCYIFFDYFIVIDLEVFIKFLIVICIYYLYLYIYIQIYKKNYYNNKILRFFSFLFFWES